MNDDFGLANTYRRRLREVALDQHGFVTTEQAEEAGVPPVELRKIAARGGVANIGYGLYRFDDVDAGEHREFMEAVMRVGPGAYLTGDAVLALLGLGLVNPRRIRVATPRRVRRKLPAMVDLVHKQVAPEDVTTYDGVPAERLAKALVDCVGVVMRDRLVEAAEQGATEGYLRPSELRDVLTAVGATR
jgi:predicted transcriptional regulator of viral defense system